MKRADDHDPAQAELFPLEENEKDTRRPTPPPRPLTIEEARELARRKRDQHQKNTLADHF